ncbi:MAG: hypothetical protein IJ489_08095 [Clostridia bacterium]|nr:hypothetical protein [Clostridia bacterium]
MKRGEIAKSLSIGQGQRPCLLLLLNFSFRQRKVEKTKYQQKPPWKNKNQTQM